MSMCISLFNQNIWQIIHLRYLPGPWTEAGHSDHGADITIHFAPDGGDHLTMLTRYAATETPSCTQHHSLLASLVSHNPAMPDSSFHMGKLNHYYYNHHNINLPLFQNLQHGQHWF